MPEAKSFNNQNGIKMVYCYLMLNSLLFFFFPPFFCFAFGMLLNIDHFTGFLAWPHTSYATVIYSRKCQLINVFPFSGVIFNVHYSVISQILQVVKCAFHLLKEQTISLG